MSYFDATNTRYASTALKLFVGDWSTSALLWPFTEICSSAFLRNTASVSVIAMQIFSSSPNEHSNFFEP